MVICVSALAGLHLDAWPIDEITVFQHQTSWVYTFSCRPISLYVGHHGYSRSILHLSLLTFRVAAVSTQTTRGVNATGTLGVAGRAPKTRESRRRRRRGVRSAEGLCQGCSGFRDLGPSRPNGRACMRPQRTACSRDGHFWCQIPRFGAIWAEK